MENQDKILEVHEKLSNFFNQKLKLILTSVGIFVLFVFLISFFTYYKNRKEREAELKLIEAMNQHNPVQALNKILKEYSGTQAGLEAGILLWNMYYNKKDYFSMGRVLDYLQENYPSDLKPLLNYARASLFENQKEFKSALRFYKKSLKEMPLLRFVALIDVARTYEESGNLNQAIDFYRKYLEEYPDGEYKGLAEYKIYATRSAGNKIGKKGSKK